MDDMKPGNVVTPHSADDPQQPASPGAPVPDRPEEGNDPVPNPIPDPEPSANDSAQTKPPTPATGWHFTGSNNVSQPQTALPDDITWTASEYIAHEKGASWYGLLVVGGFAAAALDYWLTKDVVSTGVIVFAAIVFAIISAKKPRTQHYALTTQGLQIGNKIYYFQDFKNFSITEEGAIASIIFMPMKRFMPSLTIYVAPDMEEQVINFLSAILPVEQHRADAVDSLMRRIHF